MTNSEKKRIIKDAVDTFGLESQLRQLQEECGELIVAISHLLRKRDCADEELIEEITDVNILIQQVIPNFDEKRLSKEEQYKLRRLELRILQYKKLNQ